METSQLLIHSENVAYLWQFIPFKYFAWDLTRSQFSNSMEKAIFRDHYQPVLHDLLISSTVWDLDFIDDS